MSLSPQEQIRVLHVDDDPAFAEMTATYLERESDQFTVETATGVAEGLDRLTEEVDCVVSDYDVPGANGLEFLQTVREEFPDLPFVLFTGKGSEEVASDAISAGVTDYLQKEPGSDQFVVLANRVANAVTQARAKCRLREERQRFQILFDRLTQPTVEVEYEGDEPVVQQVNPAFEETFGYDASEIVGESLDAYIVPDDHQAEAEEINEHVREGGRLVSREVTRQTADGLREFLLENAVYEDDSGVFAVYTELSERKRREEALGELHDATRAFMTAQDKQAVADRAVETARAALDQPISGLWLYDQDDNALQPVAATANGTEVLGSQPTYTPGESLSWQAFQNGELRVYEDVRTEPERLNAETSVGSEILVPLGEHGVMNISATEPGAFSEIDVSLVRILGEAVEAALDRADREQQLRTQRAALERQNTRLEKFVGAVSHDLRNPLQLATGRVTMAQEVCDSAHLSDAVAALERMDTLISDLLTVARSGEQVGEVQCVALGSVSGDCWRTVETDGASFAVETQQMVRADSSRLRQLLENLFCNAVTHGGENVTVTIGDLPDGFYVADDGSGIPADRREWMFETGYSTTADGTGFGLDIVREIARAHGWELALTDSDDGGARFELTGVELVD